MVMEKQLLFRGVLRPLVLSVLLENETTYGYLLIKKISEASGGELTITEGALYPLLRKLEREGVIKGEVEEHNLRGKKVYKLTTVGKRQAQEELNDSKLFLKILNHLL
jgi:DNA-binding PadR family transcriptional regulator